MLDGIACALVGAQLSWSRLGVKGVTALDTGGGSTLIGWDGAATSSTSAAMLNSSFIQGFELDDYHPLAPLHSNSLVLPAMLAAAPHVGHVSDERFLLGAILGYETGPRVGQALDGLDMLSRGWHSGVVFGTLSAAAAAGTLYGLDAAGYEDAFGMAATQSCGLMSAMYESMVKRMQHGSASRNGLTAAALAAVGYVGIKRVFERPYGGWKAERPLQTIGAQMNVAYAVAVALLDGDVLVNQFTQDRINRDDVWALIDRTIAHHERAYDNLPIDERLTTQVRVTLKDGSTQTAKVVHPRGTGDRTLTNEEIRHKYAKLTDGVVSPEPQSA